MTTYVEAKSAFEKYEAQNYPYQHRVRLLVGTLAGGTPTDPKVAKGWLQSKLRDKDDLIREMVAETMIERGLSEEEATQVALEMKNLNGFKREGGALVIEGRQVKAMLKEAATIATQEKRIKPKGWGSPQKGLKSYMAEHLFVIEDKIPLQQFEGEALMPVAEATGIMQRFVSTFRGTGIQYEEYVQDAVVEFTIESDHEFDEKDWAALFLTGERNGLGASRSQGYGRFKVMHFERI